MTAGSRLPAEAGGALTDARAVGAAVVEDTFRNLVGQFSQPLCFYRELIQNALDAGSRTVEVRVEYDAARSVVIAHVIDSGCGMDRAVIDTQLTRLFSSSKEGDFTQIGKFGIGFVSVFAVGPEAVVVDTGRSGERWRVLFTPDGGFERIELDVPVEGTHVAVYKGLPPDQFDDFVARSRATVEYWCRHAEAQITFNGERVDAAFDLDAPVKIHWSEPGTELVAALTPEDEPFFGFYKGGITLLEGRRAWLPHVAFKLKSRYLEHTLTRDNVKQDENFDKAMRVLTEVVERDLAAALAQRLAATARMAADDDTRRDVLAIARSLLARIPRDTAFIPTVDGRALALADLKSLAARTHTVLEQFGACPPEGALLAAEKADHVTAALDALNATILRVGRSDPLHEFLHAAGWRIVPVHDLVGVPLDAVPSEALRELTEQASRLLEAAGVGHAQIRFGRFDYPHSCLADRPFVLQQAAGQPCSPQAAGLLREDQSPSFLSSLRRVHVVLNVAHPLLGALAPSVSPRLAAWLLARLLCLSDGLHPETERRLLEASL